MTIEKRLTKIEKLLNRETMDLDIIRDFHVAALHMDCTITSTDPEVQKRREEIANIPFTDEETKTLRLATILYMMRYDSTNNSAWSRLAHCHGLFDAKKVEQVEKEAKEILDRHSFDRKEK